MNSKNISIVVVDDDIRTRIAIEESLADSGFTTECFRTGNEGIRHILTNEVDVAIIDVRLPDTNGIDVLRLVKEYQPKVLCVLMTAYPNVEDAVRALKSGAYEYIEKPLDLKQITTVINKAIDENMIQKKIVKDTSRDNSNKEGKVSL
jgi:DNA-binding NtrC family response regulator